MTGSDDLVAAAAALAAQRGRLAETERLLAALPGIERDVRGEWGIGTVLLLAAQQLLPAKDFFAAGHCDPSVGRFFAQVGYTVLHLGEKLILPVEDDPGLTDLGSEHARFYRQGPI